jgi:hypothetical protein
MLWSRQNGQVWDPWRAIRNKDTNSYVIEVSTWIDAAHIFFVGAQADLKIRAIATPTPTGSEVNG